MRKKYGILAMLSLLCLYAPAQLKVLNLLTENLSNPLGIDNSKPRFSWQLSAEARNVLQASYEIRVFGDGGVKDRIWSSGQVASGQSVLVPYGGPALSPGKKYFWQVRVRDQGGSPSPWSATASWQMGLLQPSDWTARWIGPGYGEPPVNQPSPLLRKTFSLRGNIKSATVYVTAHGLYEAHINGRRVGDSYLTPGWTSYNKRLLYQAYDVTGLLRPGSNAMGVTLGSGWYRGHLAWDDHKNLYGSDVSLLLELVIEYADGTTQRVVSDSSWRSATGEIRSSEIYDGEQIDARLGKKDWTLASFDDMDWIPVKQENFSLNNLLASANEPVVKHETFQPRRIFRTPKGEQVIDFGQNLVGWVVLRVRGHAGDTIRVSHAEVLDKSGNFYTDNLRQAKSQDTYILKGGGEEIFEPHFTFHGFQFIKVEGYPGDLQPADFTAVALYSDMKQTGSFGSSNPLINQLQHNIQWGQRGNFLDVPTDCPQRDERLGWTGDAQVFSRTAAFNMGVNNFFAKWLKDLAADQAASGSVPFVVPNVLNPSDGGSAGWADAATIIPWNMYLAYGDRNILEQQYPSMKAWVDYMTAHSQQDLWNTGFHFGDWLFYRPEDDNDGRAAVTDKYLIAQCFIAHSTQLLASTAALLGKQSDADHYTALLSRIREAFVKEYLTPSGRLVSGTQTAYVLALEFDMLPEALRRQAAQRLADNVKDYDYHLTTGFLGTPYLCHVLSRFGYTDIAYKLLLQDSYPSWLYPVRMGATTIWERWDGIKPDSSFQTPGMNSFNHYSYGAIGDWMYRVMAGLDTYEDGPGYHHIRVMPHPGGGFTRAGAELATSYGRLSSKWTLQDGKYTFDIEIPANTHADIFIPAGGPAKVSETGRPLPSLKTFGIVGMEEGYLHLQTGSGKYSFTVNP